MGRKRLAVLSNAIPDAWLASCGADIVRRIDPARHTPVPLRAGVCGHLAYLPALLQDVDGIVLTTSCDQMRRGAEGLNDPRRVFLFDMPSSPCPELLSIEKARLERWAEALRACLEYPTTSNAGQGPTFNGKDAVATIAILGGHFCGDIARVDRFFGQRGIGIRLWGCEGGENVGDICQRPNDTFHTRLAQLIRERALDGLVVVRTTWCDLWRAAFARIQETVSVPVTEWVFDGSCEGQPFPDARSVARLEAFCELLTARKQEPR